MSGDIKNKKIIVFNVAAEHSGALTILNEFYNELVNHKNAKWTFVLSTPELQEQEHIEVLNYRWIKKSWFYRLYFDYFIAPRLVRKGAYDLVFSMQNTIIPLTKKKQIIYLHQPIPFSSIKFGIKENKKLWAYQNILSGKIYRSLRRAEKIIVQTNWMKDEASLRAKVPTSKFLLSPPSIKIDKVYSYKDDGRNTFFYPANFVSYKNHKSIINATKKLMDKGIKSFEILFTGNQEDAENNGIFIEGLPIMFTGRLTHDEVMRQYSKSILLFPSKLETFGLPLLEARMSTSPILAGDTLFAKEILEGYDKAIFFDLNSPDDLLNKMINFIENKSPNHVTSDIDNLVRGDKTIEEGGWGQIIQFIETKI